MAARLRRAVQLQLGRNLAAAGTRSSSFHSHSSSNIRRAVASSSSSSSWSFCNTNPAGALNASYRWTTLRFRVSNSGYSSTFDSDDAGRREPLFPGCDYNHWLVTMEFQDPNTTREQKIDTFIKTLANVVGSVEEAKKRIYALSTTRYTGFMCEISEELSEKMKKEPGVEWVLPDSYADPIKKTYGVGDLYINGEIIPDPNPLPRPSARDRPRRRRDTMPVERRDIQMNRDPIPLNMNQQQDYRGPSAPGYRSNVQQPSVHNYCPGPSNVQGPPVQNYGPGPVNNQGPPVQNYGPGPVNSQGLPVQNYGPGSMNQGPRVQNYGPGPMNNQGPPFQNYGPGPMNNQVPPFQNYGHGNYGPGPIHNQGPPVPNYAQNYGPGPANSQAYPGPGQDYQLNSQYTPAQSQWSPQGQDFRSQFNTQGAARQDYRGPPSPGPNYRQPSYTPGPPPHSYSPPPVQDYRPPISSSPSFSAQDSSMSESKTDVPSIENGEKQQTVKSEDPEQVGKSDSYKWPIEESK